MSFFGAVRLLVASRSGLPMAPAAPARTELPPEMARGSWAAWALASRVPARGAVRVGDACRTGAGREGRFVEIVEGDRRMLICQEA